MTMPEFIAKHKEQISGKKERISDMLSKEN